MDLDQWVEMTPHGSRAQVEEEYRGWRIARCELEYGYHLFPPYEMTYYMAISFSVRHKVRRPTKGDDLEWWLFAEGDDPADRHYAIDSWDDAMEAVRRGSSWQRGPAAPGKEDSLR